MRFYVAFKPREPMSATMVLFFHFRHYFNICFSLMPATFNAEDDVRRCRCHARCLSFSLRHA